MPKTATKATKPTAAPKPEKVKQEVVSTEERKIEYPYIEVCGVRIPLDQLRITKQDAIDYLGWESESDYFNRMKEKYKGLKMSDVGFGDDYLMRDAAQGISKLSKGNKIKCNHNSKNRPLTESWCRSLAFDILNLNWQFNCETIIVSNYGTVLSGQHRLIALILACQEWEKNNMQWAENWPEEPYILSLVATGASEEQKVVNTLDNVRTRTLSDIIYTSPLFDNLIPLQRKKASISLQGAVDFLWDRTVVARLGGDVPRTHSISMEFFSRHPKITEFVQWMSELDGTNRLTYAGIPTIGRAAGALYLMASADSPIDDYTSSEAPNEEVLNWDLEKKAKRFWEGIAKDISEMKPVRKVLASLRSELDDGIDAKVVEKLCCLAKAWAAYKDDLPIEESNIRLRFDRNPKGEGYILVEWPTFGGIDHGQPNKETKPEKTNNAPPTSGENGEDEDKEERERVMAEKVKENNRKMRRTGPYANEQGDPNDLS